MAVLFVILSLALGVVFGSWILVTFSFCFSVYLYLRQRSVTKTLQRMDNLKRSQEILSKVRPGRVGIPR